MRVAWISLMIAAACTKSTPPAASGDVAGAAAAETPATASSSAGVPLVVLLVVDQLPVRLLDAMAEHYEGGLARLMGEQAYHGVARYAYAVTFTCPGHATISTGASPSEHGIVSNRWRDPADASNKIYCAKPEFLLAEALADKVVDAGGQVASISLKDRAAVMMGGHRPTLRAFYDPEQPGFNDERLASVDVARWLAEPWEALKPEVYAAKVGPDEGRYEADRGVGITFPYPAISDHPEWLPSSPFGGEALVDAALAAQGALSLGADATPDLLAISFSETDYIGHAFTSESWEALDNMLRLDAAIGRLLSALDASVGADDYAVILTSDHGSVQPTEVRVPPEAVSAAATRALARVGGEGEVVFEDPSLYLPAAVRADAALAEKAGAAIAADVAALAGIHSVHPWRVAPPEGELAEDVALSVHPARSGDLYVVLDEGALYDYAGSPGKGTSHGTPWDNDQRVPFLAVGRGIAPGKGTADHDVRQVAVTAAALLGVEAPAQASLGPVDAALEESAR